MLLQHLEVKIVRYDVRSYPKSYHIHAQVVLQRISHKCIIADFNRFNFWLFNFDHSIYPPSKRRNSGTRILSHRNSSVRQLPFVHYLNTMLSCYEYRSCIISIIDKLTNSIQNYYTRRRFGGRHPLCGTGVTSLIAVTSRPAA